MRAGPSLGLLTSVYNENLVCAFGMGFDSNGCTQREQFLLLVNKTCWQSMHSGNYRCTPISEIDDA